MHHAKGRLCRMRVGAPAALAYKRAPLPNTRAAYRLAILPHAVNLGSLYPEKKSASVVASRGRLAPPPVLNVALARLVDLKAVLLAETRARGPDGSRMRSPQLARCSCDQVRRRMGKCQRERRLSRHCGNRSRHPLEGSY